MKVKNTYQNQYEEILATVGKKLKEARMLNLDAHLDLLKNLQ